MFVDRIRHGDRGHADDTFFRRQQCPIEGLYRPLMDRHFEDYYHYDNTDHGLKRPFSMTDPNPDYLRPRRRPRFDQMDECILDAICERLKPHLYTTRTCLVREADPVNEMHFIIRGHLDSYTTDGGRTGFFNSCQLGPCDFCGEELLKWALDPRPSIILPSSTHTVTALTEVETFALVAADVMFVASQFRKLHSKQLRHKFRFYSNQWRTWAACFIQAAWFRYKRRKEAAALK